MKKVNIARNKKAAVTNCLVLTISEMGVLTNPAFEKRIKAWLKDYNCSHQTRENGNVIVGELTKYYNWPVEEGDMHDVEIIHTNFMSFLNDLLKEERESPVKDPSEEPVIITEKEMEFAIDILNNVEKANKHGDKIATKIFLDHDDGLVLYPTGNITEDTLVKMAKLMIAYYDSGQSN